jgi:glycosyltransferase involved in cell wall biosynthesis
MDTPRVTVGMTLYNVERYLPLALDCVLAQDYADFELVACDNVSTDRTWEIITGYAERDPRIRPFRNDTNLGHAGSFRRMVELSRGELLRYTAHDDLFAPGFLSRCVAALDASGPDAVLAYPRTRIIGGAGEDLCPWPAEGDLRARSAWRRVARWGTRWHLCNELFGVIRMDAVRRTHLLMNSVISTDAAMLAELAMHGRFVQVPEELMFRRMHSEGTHQGDKGLADIATYLEPAAGNRQLTKRYALLRETVRALRDSDLPAWTRNSSAAGFAVGYGSRQVAGRLRRQVERVLRLPERPAPWDARPAGS